MLHRLMLPEVDVVDIYVDQWGCKRLTSFVLRRFRSGILKFRDSCRDISHTHDNASWAAWYIEQETNSAGLESQLPHEEDACLVVR